MGNNNNNNNNGDNYIFKTFYSSIRSTIPTRYDKTSSVRSKPVVRTYKRLCRKFVDAITSIEMVQKHRLYFHCPIGPNYARQHTSRSNS
jgi:hypothetical protein